MIKVLKDVTTKRTSSKVNQDPPVSDTHQLQKRFRVIQTKLKTDVGGRTAQASSQSRNDVTNGYNTG